LGRERRMTVEKHDAWPIVGRSLSSLYMELIEGGPAVGSAFR
jgi:hypothetical protein